MKTWSEHYFRHILAAKKSSPCLSFEKYQHLTQFVTQRFVDHVNNRKLVGRNCKLFCASLTGGLLHGCNVRM